MAQWADLTGICLDVRFRLNFEVWREKNKHIKLKAPSADSGRGPLTKFMNRSEDVLPTMEHFKFLLIYLFLAVLDLRCGVWAFTAVASLVAENGL